MVLNFEVEKFDDVYGFPAHHLAPPRKCTVTISGGQWDEAHPEIPKVMASCTERYKSRANLSINDPRTFCEGVLTLFSC